MERNQKLVEVLNDLLRINNDRVAGYEKAYKEAKTLDVDLQAIFERMANQSRNYVAELADEVRRLGAEPATGTTASGKIYRTWMDVMATFTGNDRHALLSACEYGEDAAQRAYESALASDAFIEPSTRKLITEEQSALRTSHDLIKKYRDVKESVGK